MASSYYHTTRPQHHPQQKQQSQSQPMSLKPTATVTVQAVNNNQKEERGSPFRAVIKLKVPMSIHCVPKFGVPSKRTCLLEDRPVEKTVEDFMTLPKQKTFWETTCDLLPNEGQSTTSTSNRQQHRLTISLSTSSSSSSSRSSSPGHATASRQQENQPSSPSFSFDSGRRDVMRPSGSLYPMAGLENAVC